MRWDGGEREMWRRLTAVNCECLMYVGSSLMAPCLQQAGALQIMWSSPVRRWPHHLQSPGQFSCCCGDHPVSGSCPASPGHTSWDSDIASRLAGDISLVGQPSTDTDDHRILYCFAPKRSWLEPVTISDTNSLILHIYSKLFSIIAITLTGTINLYVDQLIWLF